MYVKPKKRLGQIFLIDKNIQRKIIDACHLIASDYVLEIGAGRGELTRLIADNVYKVYALEIDPYLCKILKDNLKRHSNAKIINQDILKFNLKRFFSRFKKKIKVVGNIPYYISSPIIEHLLNLRDKIETIFVTVQKEFAKRIIATAGSKDYSSLSCFIQYYTEPKVVFYIKRTSFLPMPDVDSSFIRLDIKDNLSVKQENEKLLFKIIRASFNQRRKTLRNSLAGIISPQKLGIFFNQYNINPNTRPESLTLKDFINLSKV